MGFTTEQLRVITNQSLIKADYEFETPPVCLSIRGEFGEQIFATLGNFSVLLSRPKVGKTTTTAILVASLLGNKEMLKIVPALLKGTVILWIDTEQGKPECIKTIRLISSLLYGDPKKHPENLIFLSLRQFNYSQRIEITEFAISNMQDVGFVIIDGIRDFVSSINDEREATAIADKLLKWTQEKNIHILTILHQNKGDTNARGHLGTELMNKAETVAKLSRGEVGGDRTTTVEPEFTRHKDFEPFSFSLDDNSNLFETEPKTEYEPKSPKIEHLTVDQKTNAIKLTFNGYQNLTYSKLWTGLKSSLKQIDIEFGDNKCKSLVNNLTKENYIIHNEQSKIYTPNI